MGIFGTSTNGPVYVVTLDTQGAVSEAEKLDKAIDEISKTTQQSSFSFTEFNQALEAGKTVFAALQAGVQAVFEALDRGQLITNVTNAFENLQSSVGLLADDSLQKLRTATQGTISDLELMRNANQAVQLGLDASRLDEMAAAAVKLGAAVGRDAAESFQDLITGVGRASPLILDNLGIVVSSEDAYRKYAAALKTTVDQLSEAEKKEAFRAAALDAIAEKSQRLADVQLTAAQSADKVGIALERVYDSFALGLTNSESLADSFGELSEAIGSIDLTALGQLVGYIVSIGADAATGWSMLANAILGVGDSLAEVRTAAERAATDFAKTFTSVEAVSSALDENSRALAEARLKHDELSATLERQEKAFNAGNQVQQIMSAIQGTLPAKIDATRAALEQQASVMETLRANSKALEGQFAALSASQDKSSKSAESYGKAIKSIAQVVSEGIASDKITKAIDSLATLYKQGAISQELLVAGLTSLKEEFGTTAIEAEIFQTALEGIDLATEDLARVLRDDLDRALYDLERSLGGAVVDMQDVQDNMRKVAESMFTAQFEAIGLGTALNNIVTPETIGNIKDAGKSLSEIFTESLLDADANGQINQAFAQAVGGLGSVLSDVLFEELGLESGGIGARVGQAIGTAIGAYFTSGSQAGAEAGGFFGETVGAFVDKLTGATTDAGTLARRNVESFIDDIINEINFQIIDKQGNALSITDLVLGDASKFNEGSDFQTRMEELFRLDPSTFTAFQGVGGALGQLFAEDFAAGAQIGRILLDEFGGSIDNLKLLFQELDVTFEEFQQALVDAFYAGEISALEFNSIMRDSNELFEEGISGIGNYQKAFQDFVASQGQGRLSTQRLVDIFTEAEEAGIDGFGAIRQALLDMGASTESVNQLFDTLAARGISSVNDLREASEQMRIAIVGDLQALNFEGFNDFSDSLQQGVEDVKALEDQLGALPEKVETQVTVRVRAEYENDDARTAFGLLGSDAPGIAR